MPTPSYAHDAKPWPYSDIRSCCQQSVHVVIFRYDSTLLSSTFLHQGYFCMRYVYTQGNMVILVRFHLGFQNIAMINNRCHQVTLNGLVFVV